MKKIKYAKMVEPEKYQPKKEFDEMQLASISKAYKSSLGFLIALVLLNGIIADTYMWASPSVQAVIICVLTSFYGQAIMLFKNAYIPDTSKLNLQFKTYIIAFGLASVFVVFEYFYGSNTYFNANGVLIELEGFSRYFVNGSFTYRILWPLIPLIFAYNAVIIGIKLIVDKRNNEED